MTELTQMGQVDLARDAPKALQDTTGMWQAPNPAPKGGRTREVVLGVLQFPHVRRLVISSEHQDLYKTMTGTLEDYGKMHLADETTPLTETVMQAQAVQ